MVCFHSIEEFVFGEDFFDNVLNVLCGWRNSELFFEELYDLFGEFFCFGLFFWLQSCVDGCHKFGWLEEFPDAVSFEDLCDFHDDKKGKGA